MYQYTPIRKIVNINIFYSCILTLSFIVAAKERALLLGVVATGLLFGFVLLRSLSEIFIVSACVMLIIAYIIDSAYEQLYVRKMV